MGDGEEWAVRGVADEDGRWCGAEWVVRGVAEGGGAEWRVGDGAERRVGGRGAGGLRRRRRDERWCCAGGGWATPTEGGRWSRLREDESVVLRGVGQQSRLGGGAERSESAGPGLQHFFVARPTGRGAIFGIVRFRETAVSSRGGLSSKCFPLNYHYLLHERKVGVIPFLVALPPPLHPSSADGQSLRDRIQEAPAVKSRKKLDKLSPEN